MINKAPETMTARERVMRTFAFEKTDRIPLDYAANPIIHNKLCRALGFNKDEEGLLDALGVDFRITWPEYTGPPLFKEKPGRNVNTVYGFYTKRVENAFGGYEDFCDFPLAGADPAFIAHYPLPSADDFSVEDVDRVIKNNPNAAIYAGGAGYPDIINATSRVMGMEETLINLVCEDEATLQYIDRRANMELRLLERVIQRGKGRIDFVWLGEDLGTQIAPMISPALFRKVIRPRHQRFIDLAKSYNLPVMIHSCGSSSWAYEDFIEMGIGAVDTLQPEAVDMHPTYLKEKFGKHLAFHGCISTAGLLANGTAEQVKTSVRDTIQTMMPGGGYMLAPTHMIQDNTPVENIVAMYNSAHQYGRWV